MDSTLIYEKEAEFAFSHIKEIELAAVWCKNNYPHKFGFLNEMYNLLVAEHRSLVNMGFRDYRFSTHLKLQSVLSILSPSQALRLLEAYKRSSMDDQQIWKSKNIIEMERIEKEINHKRYINRIKDQLRENND